MPERCPKTKHGNKNFFVSRHVVFPMGFIHGLLVKNTSSVYFDHYLI